MNKLLAANPLDLCLGNIYVEMICSLVIGVCGLRNQRFVLIPRVIITIMCEECPAISLVNCKEREHAALAWK